MSFLGGAECSTAANPLSQFSKLGHDDKSLQRDRLVGRAPANLQGMRSNGGMNMSGSQDNVSLDTFL
jgi:peroxin-5